MSREVSFFITDTSRRKNAKFARKDRLFSKNKTAPVLIGLTYPLKGSNISFSLEKACHIMVLLLVDNTPFL